MQIKTLPHYLMGLHVDSKVVLILEQPVAYHTFMALRALGFKVFVALVSLFKHTLAVWTRAVLNGKRIHCWYKNVHRWLLFLM